MRNLTTAVLSALFAALFVCSSALADSVDVVVDQNTPAQAEESGEAATPPAEAQNTEQEEALPVVRVYEKMQITPDVPEEAYDDGLYTPGELAIFRNHHMANEPWAYNVDLNKYDGTSGPMMEKTWVHKAGLAGVDLVPFMTGDTMYAAKKAAIQIGAKQAADDVGDWFAEKTGMGFWESDNQNKLERKLGWAGALLSFF